MIAIYSDDVLPTHARPRETAQRLHRVLDFFGSGMTLADVNAGSCRRYVEHRGSVSAARRELEDLRAAIGHHWKEGLCSAQTPIVLPPPSLPRDRWLTRSEAARMLWAAWRLRQKLGATRTRRPTAQHLARFLLVAQYTGTRAGAICGAALAPTPGRGWVDLDRGVFYRRAIGRRETKKRQTPVRIPTRLLAHMRRWQRLGLSKVAVVEWRGKPVRRINKVFWSVRKAAGFGADVVPHTYRHTCGTWMAQAGVPVFEAAGFLGMSPQVFETVYGHHHPDFQGRAAAAFGPKSDRIPMTEREQTSTNVVELHRRSQ